MTISNPITEITLTGEDVKAACMDYIHARHPEFRTGFSVNIKCEQHMNEEGSVECRETPSPILFTAVMKESSASPDKSVAMPIPDNCKKSSVYDMVATCAKNCDKPIGYKPLDELHERYCYINAGGPGSDRKDFPHYYRFLYNLGNFMHEKRVTLLEVGCRYGYASLHFLKGGGAYAFCIDCEDKFDHKQFNGMSHDFLHADASNIETLKEIDFSPDILFIDTNHSYKQTKDHFEMYSPLVKPGGLVLFDDITAPEYVDGCVKFFNELEGDKLLLPELHPEKWGFGCWFKPE